MIEPRKLPARLRDADLQEMIPRPEFLSEDVLKTVRTIVAGVREEGDSAVLKFTEELDGVALFAEDLRVSETEMDEARKAVDRKFLRALRVARDRILSYHREQCDRSWFRSEDGMLTGELLRPLASVGCYVPGGLAAYPSSVLMTVLPAKVAGVERIQLTTPPRKDGSVAPETLAAAHEAGCSAVYRVGGAQAVAALAYGTATIPKVDKIVGPGNVYVTAAKREVFGAVGIDGLAGPSEIVIVADDTPEPGYVAADMLAQMEHGSGASAILVTPSSRMAERVRVELRRQVAAHSHLTSAVEKQAAILIPAGIDEAIEVANRIAPEHLELLVADPLSRLAQVRNAGAILLGEHTPASLSDYVAGPNHVLPTGGAACYHSPLSVRDFVKYSSVLLCNREALGKLTPSIELLAGGEGLRAHADAVTMRKKGRR